MRTRPPYRPLSVALLGVCLCLLLSACSSSGKTTDVTDDHVTVTSPEVSDGEVVASAAETVAALAAIPIGPTPDHFLNGQTTRLEGDFDVNSYFTALKHLSVEEGWILDYVYEATDIGGHPILYARPDGQPAYDSFDAWEAASREGEPANMSLNHSEDYLDHIKTDDTPEGYFELALFQRTAGDFYLWWHGDYSNSLVVYDKQTLEQALEAAESMIGVEVPAEVRKPVLKADPRPTCGLLDNGTAVVRLVTFSNWGGLVETRYTFKRQLPHTPATMDHKTLVEYDCGLRF